MFKGFRLVPILLNGLLTIGQNKLQYNIQFSLITAPFSFIIIIIVSVIIFMLMIHKECYCYCSLTSGLSTRNMDGPKNMLKLNPDKVDRVYSIWINSTAPRYKRVFFSYKHIGYSFDPIFEREKFGCYVWLYFSDHIGCNSRTFKYHLSDLTRILIQNYNCCPYLSM